MRIARTLSLILLAALVALALPAMAQTKAHKGHKAKGAKAAKAATASDQNAEAMATIGKAASGFTLKDADGKTHALADFKDKIVVLTWINTTCPFVQDHLKKGTIDKLAQTFKDQNVAFLNIDSNPADTADQVKTAGEKYGLKTMTLLDPTGEVGKAYAAKTTPNCFVVGKDGKLKYTGAIDNAPMGEVKGGGQTVNYVDQAVKALLADQPVPTPSTKSYGCGMKYAKNAEAKAQKQS